MERKLSPPDTSAAQRPMASMVASIRIVERIADDVKRLHAEGRIHGQLRFEHIFATGNPRVPTLPPPPNEIVIGGSSADLELCPPQLRGKSTCVLPTQITAAENAIRDGGKDFDPRRIDLYQLAVLLVRLIAQCSLRNYLSSPRAKAAVPEQMQTFVDRALGHSPQHRIDNMDAFLSELSSACKTLNDLPSQTLQGPPVNEDTASALDVSTAQDTRSSKVLPRNDENQGDLPFTQLGHYRVLQRIGRGGMGDVYLGVDSQLDRKVALKVLPAEFARSSGFVDRFRHEAASAARLSHANIVPIYFAGEDAGHLFFAMQYVDGESVAEWLTRRKKLDFSQCAALLHQTLGGLAHAHAQGMVHRDIKPANLLIDHRLQRTLIADFGLVKSLEGIQALTATGTVMGTAEYISPEQGQGFDVDHRTDQYSLGVVAYQAVCGRLPFSADSHMATIFKHVHEPLPPLADHAPNIPVAFSSIVTRMLSKDPNQRFPNCSVIIRELQQQFPEIVGGDDLNAALEAGEPPHTAGRVSHSLAAESQVILAPRFPAAPEWPRELPEQVRLNWFTRGKAKMLGLVARLAPPIHERLLNTQQQMDGVVTEYERRHDVLLGHVQAAEDAVKQMRQQLDAWRHAEGKIQQPSPAEAERSQAAQLELQAEIELQESELDDMRLRVSQVSAKLAEYRNQRDLLCARLQMANAQAQVFGAESKSRSSTQRVYALCIAISKAAAVAILGGGILWMLLSEQQIFSSRLRPATVTPSLPTGHPERFTSANLIDQEIALDFDPTCVAFAPKSNNSAFLHLAIGANDGTVYLAIYEIGNPHSLRLHKFLGHRHAVHRLCFSRDGNSLASADEQGEIRVWAPKEKVNPGRRILSGHTGRVDLLRFNDEASQILSASRDRTIRIWDVLHEREIERIERLPGQLSVFHSWVPRGEKLMIAPGLLNPTTAGFWSMRHTIDMTFMGNDLQKTSFLFESQEILADATRSSISIEPDSATLRIQTPGQTIKKIGHDIHLTVMSEDARVALTARRDGSLTLWNVVGEFESTPMIDRENQGDDMPESWLPIGMAISSDNQRAATVSHDDGLQLWDLPEFDIPNQEFEIHRFDTNGTPTDVQFGKRGLTIAASSGDGIHQWELESRFLRRTSLRTEQGVTAFAPTRGAFGYVFGLGGAQARENVAMLQFLPHPSNLDLESRDKSRFFGHSDVITGVALINRDSKLITASRDGTIRYWDVDTREELSKIEIGVPINRMAASPDSQLLLVATDDPEILVYEISSQTEQMRLEGHHGAVQDVRWSGNGEQFVSAGRDGIVRAWDLASRTATHVFQGHVGAASSAAILSHAAVVVSGGEDRTVRVWDTATLKESIIFRGHESDVIAVDLSPSGGQAVSGSRDQTIRVWNLLGAAAQQSTNAGL